MTVTDRTLIDNSQSGITAFQKINWWASLEVLEF
jgi:hypothetical protein